MSTPAYTLSENDSVKRAIEMIIQHDIGRVTVVDEQGKISGIADRQDLMDAFVNGWSE